MAGKVPDNDAIVNAMAQLSSKHSDKRRSAAKTLRRAKTPQACPALLTAVTEELKDSRTWETQYHMIVALGDCGCKDALPLLRDLSKRAQVEPAVYSAMGRAMVMLPNEEARGIETAIELLGSKNIGLIEGALCAVACLRLPATPEEARRIVSYVKAMPPYDPKDASLFVRVWVAAAAAGWDKTVVNDFLVECAASGESQLVRAATASLKGHHVKWSPL